MSKTILAVGEWQAFGKLVSSAIVNGWSVLHTDLFDDVAAVLEQRRADLILLSGGTRERGWDRIADSAWAIRADTPIIALSTAQSQDVLVSALIGAAAPAYGSITDLLWAEGPRTHLAAGIGGLFRRSDLSATLTLIEPLSHALPADIRRAIDYVDRHYADPITLESGARVASYSRCHFCKRFKEYVGLSFVNYLARVRIRHAVEMLTLSEKSVTEIAFAVGYNDLTHFERVFRAILLQSPSRFRNRAKDLPEAG